ATVSGPTTAIAQPDLGQIIGTVVDLRGDAIPGATVVVARPDSLDRRNISTNESGFFQIHGVAPGVSVHIVVRATGFDDWQSPALVLKPGQVVSLGGISLKLAAQNT